MLVIAAKKAPYIEIYVVEMEFESGKYPIKAGRPIAEETSSIQNGSTTGWNSLPKIKGIAKYPANAIRVHPKPQKRVRVGSICLK